MADFGARFGFPAFLPLDELGIEETLNPGRTMSQILLIIILLIGETQRL